jgi:hypothetical protein
MGNVKAGSAYATGRPATGRTFAVSVRITKEAADILNTKRNKSEYIDHLIKQDERLNHLLHSEAPSV